MKNLFDEYMVHKKAGDLVFSEGESGEDMYIVHAGAVEISREVEGRRIVLARLEKGDFFGEMAILENLPRSATVQVVEDAILLRVNKLTFEKLLKSNIEIPIRMLRKYSIRLREATMEIEKLQKRQSRGARIRVTTAAPVRTVTKRPTAKAAEKPRPYGCLLLKGSGHKHLLTKAEYSIGRKDPVTGAHPDIDLSTEDMVRSVSRRHARIMKKEDGVFLMEEVGVANGTFLNGERLKTGAVRKLSDDDVIKFGLVTASFTSETPATP